MKRLTAAIAAAIILCTILTGCGETQRKKTNSATPTAAATATVKPKEDGKDTNDVTPTPLLDTDKTLEEILPESKDDKATESKAENAEQNKEATVNE